MFSVLMELDQVDVVELSTIPANQTATWLQKKRMMAM